MERPENTQNSKRARDEGNDEKEGKKQERDRPTNKNVTHNYQKRYEFCDGIGVFDFPWLKEGVIFKGEDCFDEHEEKFPPCLLLDEAPGIFAPNYDRSCSQNLSVSPAKDANFHDDDSLWSLLVDDLEPIDCIWSCVVDQPLDISINKV